LADYKQHSPCWKVTLLRSETLGRVFSTRQYAYVVLSCGHNLNKRIEMTECPTSRDALHHYTYTVAGGTKSEYEPQQYGEAAVDTLYKRVEYSYMSCSCGQVKKEKVRIAA
jgi:hypothetical protein